MALGRDGRLSSPELAAALVDGLTQSGADVLDIGLGPTPMLYFAVHELGADAGVQVTGSHNPPDYNGFKMMLGKGSFFGERIQELGRISAAGDLESGSGERQRRSMSSPAMSTRLAADYHGAGAIDVVWDAGNGVAGARHDRARRPAARPPRAALRRGRRHLSQPSSGPDGAPRTSST